VRADYLISGQEDPAERVPELSRRARGFPVWAVLRSLGRNGVEELVDRLARHARRFADGVAEVPGLRVVNDVEFTQVLVAAADDRQTSALGARILAEGTAALTPGRWRDLAVLRCSVSGWATTDDDIDRTLAVVGRLAADTADRHHPA
jgi:glutamate/tyrosine decarboxylase-like PLP-dependent enzyme